MSSLRREPAELAALLSRKARDDATAMRELAGNSEISDEIVGFHAQQAVEKWLKAVLASRSLTQLRTHDIDKLSSAAPTLCAGLPASSASRRIDDLRRTFAL